MNDDREPNRTRRRERLLLLACGLALLAWALLAAPSWAEAADSNPQANSPVPQQCRQLLLSLGESWNSPKARLQLFERTGPKAPWKPVGQAFPAVLGKNGLAWGLGLAQVTDPRGAPGKREGDGKAPAGVFALGPAFARDPAELGVRPGLPVLDLRRELLCVDSPDSRFYNRILPAAEATPKDFDSAEDMLEVGDPYRFGLVVEHNLNPIRPGAGSCIFLHIWRAPDRPTAGCTAMAAGNLYDLLTRLRTQDQPTLVQLPRDQYVALRKAWGLPGLQ